MTSLKALNGHVVYIKCVTLCESKTCERLDKPPNVSMTYCGPLSHFIANIKNLSWASFMRQNQM